MRLYVVTVRPHGVSRLGNIRIDHALVTALVEWWCQEISSSSLGGTITLQDVAILLGLRIDKRPVTSHPTHVWQAICYELLGLSPDACSLNNARLRLRWLQEHFGVRPYAIEDVVRQYARAYMLGHTFYP